MRSWSSRESPPPRAIDRVFLTVDLELKLLSRTGDRFHDSLSGPPNCTYIMHRRHIGRRRVLVFPVLCPANPKGVGRMGERAALRHSFSPDRYETALHHSHFVGSLPAASDSTSGRTPLPSGWQFPPIGPAADFHAQVNAPMPSVHKKNAPREARRLKVCRQRATLPQGLPCSTIAAGGLNCRVRDGNGWVPSAMATDKSLGSFDTLTTAQDEGDFEVARRL